MRCSMQPKTRSRTRLGELSGRLKAAGAQTFDEENTTCCYAQSDKSWVSDPAGLRWETFFTHGEATTYGQSAALALLEAASAPSASSSACCGAPAPAIEAVAPKTSACCG